MRDLAREFLRQGYHPVVMTPSSGLPDGWISTRENGVEILRLSAAATKNMGYKRRALAEFKLPYSMIRALRESNHRDTCWDLVVWYSPTIFFGPLIQYLKWRSRCPTYLILRDIFPQWAVDIGLLSRGLPFRVFDTVARVQYAVADVIGVQSEGNLGFFERWKERPGRVLQVLPNWLDAAVTVPCSIRISETSLAARKIFVYTGNMGVAQGMDILLDLAELLAGRSDVGFLFVGRGSDVARLKASVEHRMLRNVLFYEEIHPDEIPDLLAQCSVGIVALDPRHKSHNIPGKFLTYMQCGLPVLANVNSDTDLARMIREQRLGEVCESNRVDDLVQLAETLLSKIQTDIQLSPRCRNFFKQNFSVEKTVNQIVAAVAV
jgi:glycosyltransferase involved in cell wall biosynthesis